jgi:hypothetical protein
MTHIQIDSNVSKAFMFGCYSGRVLTCWRHLILQCIMFCWWLVQWDLGQRSKRELSWWEVVGLPLISKLKPPCTSQFPQKGACIRSLEVKSCWLVLVNSLQHAGSQTHAFQTIHLSDNNHSVCYKNKSAKPYVFSYLCSTSWARHGFCWTSRMYSLMWALSTDQWKEKGTATLTNSYHSMEQTTVVNLPSFLKMCSSIRSEYLMLHGPN